MLNNYLNKHAEGNILYRAKLSYLPIIIKIAGITCTVGAFLFGLILMMYNILLAISFIVLFIIIINVLFIKDWIRILGTDIVITTKGLASKTGIIGINDHRETSFNRLDDIDIDMPKIWMRLFDVGDVAVQTIGKDDFFEFKAVDNPHEFKQQLQQLKEEYGLKTTNL